MFIRWFIQSKHLNTYKEFRCFFPHLRVLHLSTPRPAGKAARVVVGVHKQVVGDMELESYE